jgi:hypothetical protein
MTLVVWRPTGPFILLFFIQPLLMVEGPEVDYVPEIGLP